MKPAFADTSYYLAILSEDDAAHEKAVAWGRRSSRELVVTGFVILELGNALSALGSRLSFVRLVNHVTSDTATHIVPVSEDLLDRGIRLFADRPDKEWSLTDCISFIVMEEWHLKDALTADVHFEQAGFTALLK